MIRRTLRRAAFPLLVLGVVLASVCVFRWTYLHDNKYARPATGADTGVMLLDVEDYLADPLLFLVNGWEFYQYKLLSPEDIAAHTPDAYLFIGQYGGFELGDPAADPHGSATYRLTIFTDGQERDYALELPEIYSAYRLWINGELKYSLGDGTPGTYRPQTANALVAFTAGERIEIVLAVTDYTHLYSGMTYPPAFGSPERVARMLGLRLAVRGAAVGVAGLLGILCLLLALWQRFSGHAHLLSLLCACFVLCIGYPLVHAIPLEGGWWYDAERMGYYGMFFAVIWLQGRLCGIPRRCYRPAMAVAGLVCASVPFYRRLLLGGAAGLYAYSRLLSAYIVLAGLYLLGSTLYALAAGNRYSRPLLCAFAVFAAALVFGRAYPWFEPVLLGWHTELAGFAVVLVAAATVCWDAAVAFRERRVLRDREQTALALLDRERERGRMQQAFQERMQTLRHDYKNQVLALRVHLKAGRYERLEQELAGRLEELGELESERYTGNELVDAFLGAAALRARAGGIRLELVLSQLPPALAVPDRDLAGLLSNILDNALEACGGMPREADRWIRLEIAWHRGTLVIDCRNAHGGVRAGRPGRYATTKPDPQRHGFGLRIMRAAAERHGGLVEVDHDQTEFRVYASLSAAIAPPEGAGPVQQPGG